jgi:shikimate kinase / 3-dehydroquinate synthase
VIVLIGFMGAGKTTVGRLVATRVGLPFVDTDEVIESREGRTIPELFEEGGEPAFRELERGAVLEVLDGPEAVVALGGGALGDPAVARALAGKDVVLLEVSLPEARKRTGEGRSRPMLQRDPLTLLKARRASYESAARATVATDGRTPEEVARAIAISLLGDAAAGELLRRVVVPLGRRSYEVVVGPDLLARLDGFLPDLPGAEKAFLVSDSGLDRSVEAAEGALLSRGLKVESIRLEGTERSKSVEVVAGLWDELAARGAHKRDLVLGLGGGVVSDVAGFVASTYARGMPLVHLPTTLLAQVDAAIGGKCGVNLPAGKNLLGAIYQPRAVICDIGVLSSLPDEEFRSGMAEVIKYGLIADPSLLADVGETYRKARDGDPPTLVSVVARCAAIKASFVASDEHDSGRRAFLNYGHTFAHAIERSHRFGGIRHGEAVAMGMMAAAYLSHEVGRLSEDGVAVHRDALESVGLPCTMELELEELESAWQHDKKYSEGVRFVLLNEIGHPQAGISVDRPSLRRALSRLAG